jgi:hypothetical protein
MTPHERAFELLITEYKAIVDRLTESQYDALPLMLEQPIRVGHTFSSLGTSKGKHFCMLPAGPWRDAFVNKLIAELDGFIAESEGSSFENLLRSGDIYGDE